MDAVGSTNTAKARTLAAKIWDEHIVAAGDGEPDLLYVDLHLVHEVTSPQAFESLRLANRRVRRPDLTVATMDHDVPTRGGRPAADEVAERQMSALESNCRREGVPLFGMGTSEVEHVLATQCLRQRRPKTMAVSVDGALPLGVTAKDVALGIIARIGVDGGRGHVIEYRGSTIRGLSMEGRMTVCNMTIEGGARAGMVAPDETTFTYLRGRP